MGRVVQKFRYPDMVTSSLFWNRVCLGLRYAKSSRVLLISCELHTLMNYFMRSANCFCIAAADVLN